MIGEAAHEAGVAANWSLASLEEARRRILASIAVRQGQPLFRKQLLHAYAGRCAISGCDLEEVLEAAHISAYAGKHTNHVQNGLLLRADLHTLFDRGLLGIDPSTWTVVLHPKLSNTQYGEIHGTSITLPEAQAARPNRAALLSHLAASDLVTSAST